MRVGVRVVEKRKYWCVQTQQNPHGWTDVWSHWDCRSSWMLPHALCSTRVNRQRDMDTRIMFMLTLTFSPNNGGLSRGKKPCVLCVQREKFVTSKTRGIENVHVGFGTGIRLLQSHACGKCFSEMFENSMHAVSEKCSLKWPLELMFAGVDIKGNTSDVQSWGLFFTNVWERLSTSVKLASTRQNALLTEKQEKQTWVDWTQTETN